MNLGVLANKGLGVVEDAAKLVKDAIVPTGGFKNAYNEIKGSLSTAKNEVIDARKYGKLAEGAEGAESYMTEGYQAASEVSKGNAITEGRKLSSIAKDYWNQGGTKGKAIKVGAAVGAAYGARVLSGSTNPFVNSNGDRDIIGIPFI